MNSIEMGNGWAGRAGSAQNRASSARARCGSPFPPMPRAPVACSLSAHTCFPATGAAQTAAECTALPDWLRAP
jgi:hypothetical protein